MVEAFARFGFEEDALVLPIAEIVLVDGPPIPVAEVDRIALGLASIRSPA